jgi:hypothetical protein
MCLERRPGITNASKDQAIFVAYFPYFEKIKAGLWAHLSVSVSCLPICVNVCVSSHNNFWTPDRFWWNLVCTSWHLRQSQRRISWIRSINNTNATAFQIFESVNLIMKSYVFWNTMPGSSLRVNRCFRGKCLLCLLPASCRFVAWLIFDPEDGGKIFLRNVDWLSRTKYFVTTTVKTWNPTTLIFLEDLHWSSWK